MSALEAPEVGLCSVSLNRSPVAELLLLQGTRVVLGVCPDRTLDQRSEEHTSELQSLRHVVCRLLLEKKERRGIGGTPPAARRPDQALALATGVRRRLRGGCGPRPSTPASGVGPLGGPIRLATSACSW